jgi:hypothetical protein
MELGLDVIHGTWYLYHVSSCCGDGRGCDEGLVDRMVGFGLCMGETGFVRMKKVHGGVFV